MDPDSLYGQFIEVRKVLIQSGIHKAGLDRWLNSEEHLLLFQAIS